MVEEGDNFVYYLENFMVYHFDFDIISIMFICTANNDIM